MDLRNQEISILKKALESLHSYKPTIKLAECRDKKKLRADWPGDICK